LTDFFLSASIKDIPGASEQVFLIARNCYWSFKQL